MLLDNPTARVEVGGHTDNQGSRQYNMDLSRNRAQSVMEYMIAAGVDASRMEVVGYGPDQPVVPNDSEENMARNRRIEFRHLNVGE